MAWADRSRWSADIPRDPDSLVSAVGVSRLVASSSRSQVAPRVASGAAYLTWERPSASVRWCPLLAMAIVTHLVTQPFTGRQWTPIGDRGHLGVLPCGCRNSADLAASAPPPPVQGSPDRTAPSLDVFICINHLLGVLVCLPSPLLTFSWSSAVAIQLPTE